MVMSTMVMSTMVMSTMVMPTMTTMTTPTMTTAMMTTATMIAMMVHRGQTCMRWKSSKLPAMMGMGKERTSTPGVNLFRVENYSIMMHL